MTHYFFRAATCTVLILIFGLVPAITQAAQMYFGAASPRVVVGQKFEVGVFLNTGEDTINAVEASIRIPLDLVEIKDIWLGGSSIIFWVEEPKVNPASPGTIHFSGIMPGGYAGSRAKLFSLILESKQPGRFRVESTDERVLLHDGLGTAVAVDRAPLLIDSSATTTTPPALYYPFDDEPPETFVPVVTSSTEVFDGKWVLVFATQDKGSGIDHYEVAEIRHLPWQGLNDGTRLSWITAESPYLLQDQSLQSTIVVKAVDRAGNERLAVVSPAEYPWYEKPLIFGILALGILLLILVYVVRSILKNKKKYGNRKQRRP